MWNLLSGVIADQIYGHLDQQKFLPEEQEGCRKRSRGTNDLLYFERAVTRKGKVTKTLQEGESYKYLVMLEQIDF